MASFWSLGPAAPLGLDWLPLSDCVWSHTCGTEVLGELPLLVLSWGVLLLLYTLPMALHEVVVTSVGGSKEGCFGRSHDVHAFGSHGGKPSMSFQTPCVLRVIAANVITNCL